MMPVEKIKLIASFKVDLVDVDEVTISEIHRLFKEYRRIVNEFIEYAHSYGITSFISLHHAKYRELRQRHPTLPSHYIFTACRLAASIYESFIELRNMGMCDREKADIQGAGNMAGRTFIQARCRGLEGFNSDPWRGMGCIETASREVSW
jgi:hypothetical protein